MGRISNSWNILKASFAVLRADKELLIFPIISSIGILIVTVTFAFPLLFTGLLESFFSGAFAGQLLGFLVLFLFYVFQYTVIIFSNAALISAALIRLEGGDPTVSDGFRIAIQHFRTILGYAVISATVGVLLRTVSQRSSSLGRLVITLVGAAWNIATFLVVPVLVVEDSGPIESIRRSTELLKKTWGEQIAGNIGIGIFFGLIVIVSLLIIIPLVIVSLANGILWLGIGICVLLIAVLSLFGLVNGALSAIFTAAVYHYAVTGEASTYISADLIDHAILPNQ